MLSEWMMDVVGLLAVSVTFSGKSKMLFIFTALAISQLDGIALETKMVNSTGSGIPRVDPTKTDPFFLKVTAYSQLIFPPHYGGFRFSLVFLFAKIVYCGDKERVVVATRSESGHR
jgi:hypothetical protein